MKPCFGRGLTLMWSQFGDEIQKTAHTYIQTSILFIYYGKVNILKLWNTLELELLVMLCHQGRFYLHTLNLSLTFPQKQQDSEPISSVNTSLLGHISVTACAMIFLPMPLSLLVCELPNGQGRPVFIFDIPGPSRLMVYSNQ